MGLLDEFEDACRPDKPRCTMAATLKDLDATDKDRAAKLRAALEANHITGAGIAKVLAAWGIKVPQAAVQRHRRKVCSCG